MIIGNQEIAVHLKLVRNLSGVTSGRFMLRVGVQEMIKTGNGTATPFNLLERTTAKTENRSEFDDQHYSSKMFFLKSGVNVELNEICIFKLNSPLNNYQEDICNIRILCQLIHVDSSKSRVVGDCVLSITERSFHSYLEMNFYEGGPCQVVGTIHSCVYKFQFYSDKNSAIDMKVYAEKFSQTKMDDIVQYLSNEGKHAFLVICKSYREIAGKEPEVQCISPLKYEERDDQKEELEAVPKSEKELPLFSVMEKKESEKVIPIALGTQKKLRKKLFAPPPEAQKTEADEENPDPSFGERKKRRKIFHTTSKEIKWQKIHANEQLLHQNAQKIYQIWREIVGLLFQEKGEQFYTSKNIQFQQNIKDKVGESISRYKGSQDVDMYGDEEQMRNKLAYQLRNQDKSFFRDFKIEEVNVFPILDDSFFSNERPIFFEEHSSASGQKTKVPSEVLVIMVHGLGACRLDMEKLKSQLKRYYDCKVRCYISTSNQARTEGNIEEMGVRFAAEVDYELTKYPDIPQICFLGHSMGGLIIRSALPRLKKYKDFFHSLITLSSPHLGFLYSKSTLVDAGLWFINTMKKCQSIEQMTMMDNQNLRETFIYKLSMEPGLEWFDRLVFIGSHQDLYVPFYSARLQKHEESILNCRKQDTKGMIYCKMVENVLSNFKGEVIRVNVNFCIPEQNIDNLIGRAAHISFITNVEMIRTFTIAGPHYFF